MHLLSPRVLEASLSSGVTTVIGQELGPVWGVGLNSPWLLRKAFAAFDQWPVNIGFLARGSSSDPAPLVEGLRVEHDAHTLLIHLSNEDGRGWTTVAVDRGTRQWEVAQCRRQSDAARQAYDGLYRS